MSIVTPLDKTLISLSVDQLRDLNRRVVAEINSRTRLMALKFSPGIRVSFVSKRGPVTGTITKVNRKTVLVKSDVGSTWRVAASLLKVE